ncbi:hypothetical protein [Spiroplasma culicicola]|uniref:Uncharacterized protein n=1 Tax=Spiroplasma culicicola AES-1 TaxID=1276246 RepID=W6A5T0_9MOLU|nr:hypothetical protein [Spiroplasma culicicola]AHI52493.1 hypothetical protein SCULI_v1c01520 [Spiroplasma culicicola AES-1]
MVCSTCGAPATCSVTTGQNRQKFIGFNNSVKVDNLTRFFCNEHVGENLTKRSNVR